MSDFIYSKKPVTQGRLTKEIQAIYRQDKPLVDEFHGKWGSLAVSHNLYNGFQPYETTEHICVVIGGPVLCFQDNKFLTASDAGAVGTRAIYERWLKDKMQWDEDLSGPFVVLLINKRTSEIICATDLMSFIPVFTYQDSANIMLSTHVDVLARVSGQQDKIDIVSQADFILHGVVTFPYTFYTTLRQLEPATVYTVPGDSVQLQSVAYWVPEERYRYKSIEQAAVDLREGLKNYVNAIASEMSHIAQFISGGEDSRALSALLPQQCKRDAYIFLDDMNREGIIAKKAAEAYGANFNIATRSKTHYIEILPDCADLVGTGSQYTHVHTFGFHKSCKLNEYPAVFGGLFSDALLKGARIKKITTRFPFLPQIKSRSYSAAKALSNKVFTPEVLSEITKRRQAHLECVRNYRKASAEEWFELWPSSMNMNIPNLHGNRRLFRSYEPFMAKEVVKISASVPQSWKLNRRLFHKAAQPLLKRTKWLLHSEGRLPYFPWYINSFVQFFVWFYRQVGRRTGLIRGNQGPWGDWNVVMNSPEWQKAVDEYSDGFLVIERAFKEKDVKKLFEDDKLDQKQRVNLMQILYHFHKKIQ